MDYYKEIKQELINNEIYKKVKDYSKNRNDLTTYYNVGKIIVKARGWTRKSKIWRWINKRVFAKTNKGTRKRI